MEKYRLVYETEQEQIEIYLKGKDNEYTNLLELCFIDAFTTVYENQLECIAYLRDKGIIESLNGKLHIKRGKGKEIATQIFYKDDDLRNLSLEVCQKMRAGHKAGLSETKEYKKCSADIIRFFYSDEEAVATLNKSFYAKKLKLFVENLKGYLEYKYHDAFYEPGEIARREKFRNNIYSSLKNYETLRELKIWISAYINSAKRMGSLSRKNPFEEYERRQEEAENRKNNL